MDNCIFCKIIKGEIPCEKVYEDDLMLAFKDINPVAPVHVLMIPKTHIESAMEITDENAPVIAHIMNKAKVVAEKMGLEKRGFRLVNNCGENAGQTVMHLHFHLIGGKTLLWP